MKRHVGLIALALVLLVSVLGLLAGCGTVENVELTFMVDGQRYAGVETPGNAAIKIPDDPEKTGYTFEGWFWDENVWMEPFTANSLLNAPISNNMNIYAKFDVVRYDITYHLDGGTNAPENPATYTVEDAVTLAEPEKLGYTFGGWYTDEALTTPAEAIAVGTTGERAYYAKWTPVVYTLTYENLKTATHENPAEYTIESATITLGEPTAVEGYTFLGWFDGETRVTELESGSWGNLTLTARWEAIVYDITYHLNGGENAPANPATYTVEDAVTFAAATRRGYTFMGWYTDEACTTPATDIAVGTIGEVELWAKFDIVAYDITYTYDASKVEGTNPNPATYTVESGVSVLLPLTPIAHYQFDGWFTDSSYTTPITTIATGSIGAQQLYAKITPVVYTITYEGTKGVNNPNPVTYTIESDTITFAPISATGYTFEGWSVASIPAGSHGNITVTANWALIQYTISYRYDDTIGYIEEGATLKTTYTIEDEFLFLSPVCYTNGYTFTGWYTEKNNGEGTRVLGIAAGSTGDIVVYAQWDIHNFEIRYENISGVTHTNPESYTIETDTFTVADITKLGYRFDGWFVDAACEIAADTTIEKGSTGNLVFYAKWTPIGYSITYHTYGGTYPAGQYNPDRYTIEDAVTYLAPSLDGYFFVGWYTEAEGGELTTGIASGNSGNVTVYARYIAFHAQGGTEVDYTPTYSAAAGVSMPANPSMEYYDFAGWYTDAACTTRFDFTRLPSKTCTLYAKWTPTVYTITYVTDGGTHTNVTTYTIEDAVTLTPAVKTGYTFLGWFTDAACTSAVVEGYPVGTHGSKTLYAGYSINQYTISFETNGGTTIAPITQNYATAVTAPPAPAKNGYRFIGWYRDSALKDAYTFTTIPAENITLYAKWETVTYTITYHLDGGSNVTNNKKTYTITSEDITLYAPSKVGYTFLGWFTDETSETAITGIPTGSFGNVEVYAKWEAIVYTITYVTPDGTTHENLATYTIETPLTVLKDAMKAGYTFGGWYQNDTYSITVSTIGGGTHENITLYGKLTANSYTAWMDGEETPAYTISFVTGEGSAVEAQNVTDTQALTYPADPTREGYLFAGWYASEACTGTAYDFTAQVMRDTTLYAKWTAVEGTAIGVGSAASVVISGTTNRLYSFVPAVSGNVTITTTGSIDTMGALYNEAGVKIAQDDDSGDGDNFLMVYNVTAGKRYTVYVRAHSANVTGTATLSVNGKTTVAAGGAAGTATAKTVTYDASFTLTVPAARDGYKFLGYADAEGNMYTDATGASTRVWDKAADSVFYSVWERTVYTVTFSTGKGTPIDPITLPYGERLDLNDYVTTRDDYSFVAWMLDNAEYEATTMPDHNITLTAKWTSYEVGAIKYNTDKTAIRVEDALTGELFNVVCLDTDGNDVSIRVVVLSGTQTAGGTMTLRIIGENPYGGDGATITIDGVRVYGAPTLELTEERDYINLDNVTPAWFGATGTDSHGGTPAFTVSIEDGKEAGDTATVTVTATDAAGNVTTTTVEGVKLYGTPAITYNIDKIAIRESDSLTAELFGATAVDSFGEALTVTATLHSGTQAAGNTITVRLTATDSKGNTTTCEHAVKVYGTPTVSDATVTQVKLTDSVTPAFLGITAQDTYGKALTVTLNRVQGEQLAGTAMIWRASVTDAAGNTNTRDYTLLTYGSPELTYIRNALSTEDDMTAGAVQALGAKAFDSFGNPLTVTVTYKSGSLAGGSYVVYTLTTTDRLGNTTSIDTASIPVYDRADITLSYNMYDSDLIKLISRGEEFSFTATDSFGGACVLTVEAAEGYTLAAGETVSIYLVATDAAGNRKTSALISEIAVYGTPTIAYVGENEFLSEGTDLTSLTYYFELVDSFGKKRTCTVSTEGSWVAGMGITVTVTGTDKAGNTVTQAFIFHCGEAHDYTDHSEVVAPTCGAQGYTKHYCACGSYQSDTYVEPTGDHTYDITVTPPTCTQGYTTYTCTVCGHSYQDDFVAATEEHTWGTAATCTICGAKPYTRVDANGNKSDTGNYILFGSYPQTEVTSSSLTSTLTTMAGTKPTSSNAYAWTSYGYYVNGSISNYMWYQDIEYNGETYRGVYFTSYRPYYTGNSSSTSNSNQDDNGYYTSNIYWFKFEPILWRIVAEANGEATLVCEMLIDSQEYYHSTSSHTVNGTTVYANNYAYSNIRAWLNDSFYETAFNELERELILLTAVDNSVASTGYSSNSYACADTEDYIYLLSYKEATTYFTSDADRQKQTTDYAQCQGAWTSTSSSYAGNGYWWLRSPDRTYSYYARSVYYDGRAGSDYIYYSVYGAGDGVCPALRICL